MKSLFLPLFFFVSLSVFLTACEQDDLSLPQTTEPVESRDGCAPTDTLARHRGYLVWLDGAKTESLA